MMEIKSDKPNIYHQHQPIDASTDILVIKSINLFENYKIILIIKFINSF